MFLTNLSTIVISLFLASGIILTTLLGIILLFQFKYKDAKILLSMLFNLAIISTILLLTYGYIILFRWPGMTDWVIFLCINIISIWFYFRLFSVFQQFIRLIVVLIGVFLTVVNFGVFTVQIMTDNNLLMLLSGFLGLLIAINLHFLTLSLLIKFQKEPIYE